MTIDEAIKELELLHITTAAPAGSVAGESCRAVNDALDMAIKALREPPRVRAHWERCRDIVQCSNCGFGMFPIAYVFDNGDCVGTNVIPRNCPECNAMMEVQNGD
ncbi:MAG: hypothetical protein KH138_07165 [Firmicutes bacterium]|nr:hypothetical protein [Bacillota bacterium]